MAKLKKKKLIIFLILLVFIVMIVICSLSRKKEGIKIQSDHVSKGKLISTVSGPAKIEPEVEVKISAKVSGQIIRLGVEEGDLVKKGDFLVQLDQEEYKAAAEQSESNLKFAKAGYDKALSEYERNKKLHTDNLMSDLDLDRARAEYKQSEANVEQADALKRQAQDRLSKTTIFSPMDGIVTRLDKKQGEMAMGSQFTLDVIMIVADLSRMQAEVEIDENDVIHVEVGDSSIIMVDAFPDTTFRGAVTEIAHSGTTTGTGTQEEVTNFLVKVAMLEKPQYIRPGMSATVDVMTESLENAIKVPIQCVTTRKPVQKDTTENKKEDLKAEKDTTKIKKDTTEIKKEDKPKMDEVPPVKVVFQIKDGMAYQVEVVTGISSDTEWEIKRGLEEGWELVSGPYRILSKQLKDGDMVTVDNTLKREMREENRD